MKHWGKKLFLFKGLVSSPIRLSFATSRLLYQSLELAGINQSTFPHSAHPCEPTLHGNSGTGALLS